MNSSHIENAYVQGNMVASHNICVGQRWDRPSGVFKSWSSSIEPPSGPSS
jgi:hypothetical protein